MRTKYYIYVEVPGDENHQHDLVKLLEYDNFENAKKELAKITDKYARIERHNEEYTPSPVGRQYKKEEYGWSTIKTEVLEEN